MEKKQMIGLAALVAGAVICIVLALYAKEGIANSLSDLVTPRAFGPDGVEDNGDWLNLYGKNTDIWFMLMLVAFLMIFIKKFEWGTCLAVLLSAATSYIFYLGIQQFYFHELWSQALMIRAVICSITVVIAIGVFLGTCKQWQYLMIGAWFAVAFSLVEWIAGDLENLTNGALVFVDTGGSVIVHLCAAFFGVGVALGIKDKTAFDAPMYTTTHSVAFVWLASMLLWMLWPSFVISLVPDQVTQGTATCYMAGIGSIISTYAICMICQSKVNPLVYTYAMLCGPVTVGAALLFVGPWVALAIGLLAGTLSTLSYIYLQPKYCKIEGIMDVMGVQSLHGLGGWLGAFLFSVIVVACTGEIKFMGTLVMAVIAFIIVMATGFVIGLVTRFTRGDMLIIDDDQDFIRNDDPTGAVQKL